MSRFRRSLWLYPLFQIPLMFLVVCLIGATLFWLLGLGRPTVAVAVDMSNRTYQGQAFNAPNSVMSQELSAVRVYLDQNQQFKIKTDVQLFGFGERTVPLTNSFTSDRQKIESELNQSLANPTLPSQLGGAANLDIAIDQTTKALSSQNRCRNLLLITNSASPISLKTINQAITQEVKLNAVVVENDYSQIDYSQISPAISATNGIFARVSLPSLLYILIRKFYIRVNTNFKWIIFWLGSTWISLMWLLVLPLDKWVFQGLMNYPMNLSGKYALFNALFWTALTLITVWQELPIFSAC